jgi:hypothetical protein
MRELFAALVFVLCGETVAVVTPPETAPAMNGEREDRTLYSQVSRGAALGTIEFKKKWQDYRGEPIEPGVYVLEYGVQPILKDHAGTSTWRDFALLRGQESESGHPKVFALVPSEEADLVLDLGDLEVGIALRAQAESAF